MKALGRVLVALSVVTLASIAAWLIFYKTETPNEPTNTYIAVDHKSPEIIIDKEIRIAQDESFDLKDFYKVVDANEVRTTINGSVDSSVAGTYFISLTSTDEFGNMALARTKVIVEPKEEEVEEILVNKDNNTNKGEVINREVNHAANDSSSGPSTSQNNMGGDTQTTQPEYNPPYVPEDPSRGPYIDGVRNISIGVDTSINDLVFMLSSGISASGSVSIDFTSVNTSAPGTYSVYYYGSDGASASCSVTVY